MKQETVEEAVKRICSNQDINYSGISTGSKYQEQETLLGKTISKKDADKDSFEDVTKYKKEISYSEEEALNLLTHFAVEIQRQNKKGQYPIEIKGWFERNKEQFKNNKK